jgi:hypothetical protein
MAMRYAAGIERPSKQAVGGGAGRRGRQKDLTTQVARDANGNGELLLAP